MERKKVLELDEKELKNLDFNKAEYEYFVENCNFTDRELEVFNLRRKGKTYIEISLALHISDSTVKRDLKKIKRKIIKII